MPEINGRLKQLVDGYTNYIVDYADMKATDSCEKFVGYLKIKLMHDAALSDKSDRAIVQEQLGTEEMANKIAEAIKKAYLKAWEE